MFKTLDTYELIRRIGRAEPPSAYDLRKLNRQLPRCLRPRARRVLVKALKKGSAIRGPWPPIDPNRATTEGQAIWEAAKDSLLTLCRGAAPTELVAALEDSNKAVAQGAADALGLLGDSSVCAALRDVLQRRSNASGPSRGYPEVLQYESNARYALLASLVSALELLKDVEGLEEALCSSPVRVRIVCALRNLRDVRGLEMALGFEECAGYAIDTLVELKGTAAIPFLAGLVQPERVSYRSFSTAQAAARHLEALGWKPATQRERASLAMLRGDLDTLITCGKDGLELLQIHVRATSVSEESVVEHLSRMGTAEAISMLWRLFESGERFAACAKDCLVSRGTESLRGFLLALTRPQAAGPAASALSAIGDVRAVPYLRKALGFYCNGDHQPAFRECAEALAELDDGTSLGPETGGALDLILGVIETDMRHMAGWSNGSRGGNWMASDKWRFTLQAARLCKVAVKLAGSPGALDWVSLEQLSRVAAFQPTLRWRYWAHNDDGDSRLNPWDESELSFDSCGIVELVQGELARRVQRC